MAFLELHGIEKRFGATVALGGVDLDVRAGEVHAIIGENGAGKSTLMNVLAGVFPPDRGAIVFDGSRFAPRSPRESRERGIAHIHQELSLCGHISVAENILLGIEPARNGWLDRAEMRRRARALLCDFGCDYIDPARRLAELSLADQQVVEICRALAANARVILMDEPTSSLQKSNVQRLFGNIRRLREQGFAVIYISHFLEEVREIADRYTVLRDGLSVDTGELKVVSDAHLIAQMVGRPMKDLFTDEGSAHAAEAGDVLLSVRNLASPPQLQSASFDVHAGEVLGIGGLIGSGRTELLRALFGLASASGEIQLRGREVAVRANPGERIREGVGFLSEDRKGEGLCLATSVADNLTYTRPARFSRWGWIDRRTQQQLSRQAISQLSIRTSGPDMPVVRLSGGNQQKVALGRLLFQDPDILLLDEPTRGVDIRSKADIYREIRRLAAAGKAILMVSSYLPELLGVCNRIAVMSRGILSPARKVGEWTADSIMETAIAAGRIAEPRA